MDRKEYLKQYRKNNRHKARAYQKAWRLRNPQYDRQLASVYRVKHRERYLLTHRKQRLKIYGLTLEDFDRMLNSQNGLCKICRTSKPGGFANQWAVDHCHATGRVRGLLCTNCNKGLGYFKDSVLLMKVATEYLTL